MQARLPRTLLKTERSPGSNVPRDETIKRELLCVPPLPELNHEGESNGRKAIKATFRDSGECRTQRAASFLLYMILSLCVWLSCCSQIGGFGATGIPEKEFTGHGQQRRTCEAVNHSLEQTEVVWGIQVLTQTDWSMRNSLC